MVRVHASFSESFHIYESARLPGAGASGSLVEPVYKGVLVKILMPQPAIAARWNGALESRLRRAPLERFLRSRSLPFIAGGPAQCTDNLATATVAIVSTGLQLHDADPHRRLVERQLELVAQIACVVSEQLSIIIQELHAWRIAALVSGAQLLKTHVGLSEAARLSAEAARTYEARAVQNESWCELRQHCARALDENDDSHHRAACGVIARSLNEGDSLQVPGPPIPPSRSTISPARPSIHRPHEPCRLLVRR
jgi:hypothetical protein